MAITLPLTDTQIQDASNKSTQISEKIEEMRKILELLLTKTLLSVSLTGDITLLTSMNDRYQQLKSQIQSNASTLP